MIDRGVNPFVVSYAGLSEFSIHNLGYLSNLPSQKSVFYTTRPLPDEFNRQNEFPDPWFYKTGVFDGKFESVICQGAKGTVISGEWFKKKAAFKFVRIGAQKFQRIVNDSVKILDTMGKLPEIISTRLKQGSKIASFYGHYR